MYRVALSALAAAMAASLARPLAAEPTALTDAALDDVTAGALTGTPVADGERPAVIVADGASYTLDSRQTVELSDDAQVAARVLNATAASGSDVGNAANVLSLGAHESTSVRQENLLAQRELQGGSVGQAILRGQNVTESSEVSRSFSNASSSTVISGFQLRMRSRSTTIDQFAVFVPEFTPLQNLELTIGTPELQDIVIPAFGLDLVDEDDAGDFFGIRGEVGPFTLAAPQLVLGTFTLDGDDIALSSGFVQLPSIDLGSASIEVCIVTCSLDVSVDLGSFDGPRIDFPDLRFEGANPFQDTRINAGHGIAMVGEGTVSVTPGHLTLAATLELDLPDLTFSMDFTIPAIDGEDGSLDPISIDGPDISIEIPPITFEHALIDQEVGVSFSGAFDGMLCLALGTTDCGTGSRSEEREESRVEREILLSTATSSSSSEEFTSATRDVRAGATLTDAEAELIVMSHASADIESANPVILGDGAQRGMRSLNTVNATSTLVGNALNVTALRSREPMSARAATSLGQANVFTQYRTRYGL